MTNALSPPRFVPTLTDVAKMGDYSALLAPKAPSGDQLEEQIVHRVMQRVDLVLERRLREAIAQVTLAHAQALIPQLRAEIELVVRESVLQAVAQELP